MGTLKGIMIVLENYFPKEDDYDRLFHKFYEWLNDEKKNMMFIPARKPGYYYDLTNEETISVEDVCEYWCKSELNLHDGTQGFVIN